MKKERRKYDKEFKIMAVELCLTGKPAIKVAEELGIRLDLLSRWKKEYQQKKEGSFSGYGKPALSPEQAEIARLKKQLREAEIERDIPKKGSEHLLQERQQIFQFMKGHQHLFVVEKMCKVFKVSRSGYYHWLNRKISTRQINNQEALKLIKEIHQKSKGRYGSPKITHELKKRGVRISRPRVARIMRASNIKSITHKKYRVQTTDSNHNYPVAENLLNRNFELENIGKAWVSDITYIKTLEGWLYLTTVVDLGDRKVIGWALSQTMKTSDTVIPAWKMAINNRPVTTELIFHSDRGVQYACHDFRDTLKANKMVKQSMSRKANCWDNAVAESFFRTLKLELIHHVEMKSVVATKIEIFEFIEVWYNRQRIHASLGYMTPEQYGQNLNQLQKAA
ncbi:IS3 family transposase [Catalinimonas sp. 4WD22]|uniref:IS3 family transposase n=1 Tax=Catalinimonas locisalis TaxID=3133978 RepID=UPI003100AA6B